MKNVIKLFSILFVMNVVGMTTVKAQTPPPDGGTVWIDYSKGEFDFRLAEVFTCSFAPMNTNANGYYFKKPIIGGNITFHVIKDDWCAWKDTGDISFKVDWHTKLFISGANGKVGINTTNPQADFHVNGMSLITHTALGDWSYASLVKVNRDLTKAFVVENTINNTTVFSILGNGIVNAKKIYAESFEVTPNAMNIFWYDHVFAQDYKLRPLSELETFIKQNNHLPEIPSAKEVEENGINLGEMQAKLLLKVEELTLYIIALEKQVKELQQKVNEKGGE